MVYFEKAEIKEYFRKDSKGNKRPFFQIRLKKDSKFNEVKPIALVDINKITKIANDSNNDKINEMELQINTMEKELQQYKKQIQQHKETIEKITTENNKLKEDLLSQNKKYESILEKLSKEKDSSKALLIKINEIEKENVFLNNRNLFHRIINKKYDKNNVFEIETSVK